MVMTFKAVRWWLKAIMIACGLFQEGERSTKEERLGCEDKRLQKYIIIMYISQMVEREMTGFGRLILIRKIHEGDRG